MRYIEDVQKQRIGEYVLTYAFAVCIAFFALVATLLLGPTLGRSTPALFFLPAVIISAWYGGLVSGVITTVISGLAINFFFLPISRPFTLTEISYLLQISLFLIESILVSFFIDAGKRKDSRLGWRKREEEYRQQVKDLEEKYTKAQSEIRSRDEFLSVASHELKTPLTSMLLQIQTAIHNIRNVSLAQFSVEHLMTMLKNTENQTKRLSRMINDLLQVSLMTTGRLDLEPEEVDLTKIVEEILQDFSERFQRDNVKVNFKHNGLLIGNWDRVRIEQAVTNLISNAVKYGNRQPIDITVGSADSFAKVSVKDHGIGISKKEQERIFELFERGVSANEYKGLGIGLYITEQIVKAHGGKIAIVSKERKGSTFTIELPLKNKKKKAKNKLFLLPTHHQMK